MRLIGLLAVFGILSCSTTAASDVSRKAVFLAFNDVYSMDAEGHTRQLTFDSVRKRLPVWSPDGKKIAFMREGPKRDSMGDLVVISDSSAKLAEIHLDPTDPKDMRPLPYVDSLQWISADRIAVGGADIYVFTVMVFDINNDKEVDETDSQEIDPVFSPNGKHFVGFMGMAHFTPEEDREPEMDIDNKRVYPAEHRKVYFLSSTDPVWSHDSRKLAIAAKDETTGKFVLVLWRADGPLVTIPLPVPWDDLEADLFWQENTLLLQARQCVEKPMGPDTTGWDCHAAERTWKVADDWKALIEIPAGSFTDSAEATKQAGKEDEKAMVSLVNKVGGTSPNVWCKSCAVAKFPRRASHY